MSYLGSYIGRPTVGYITLAYLGLHVTFKLQSTVTKPFLTPCTTGPQQVNPLFLIFILSLSEYEFPNSLFCQYAVNIKETNYHYILGLWVNLFIQAI